MIIISECINGKGQCITKSVQWTQDRISIEIRVVSRELSPGTERILCTYYGSSLVCQLWENPRRNGANDFVSNENKLKYVIVVCIQISREELYKYFSI